MGVLAGYPVREVRRAMQHGHPQMTIADLLGTPLPADLVTAQKADDIRIAWRRWLSMRVKIIDEYNRIPTRTQSALLTVMGDNYAEMLDSRSLDGWQKMVGSMSRRAGLTGPEQARILDYLAAALRAVEAMPAE